MWKSLLCFACAALIGCSVGYRDPSTEATPSASVGKASVTGAELRVSRTFHVIAVSTTPGIATGSDRVDVWMPVPSSDAQQTIGDVQVETSLSYEFQTDPEYGNRILHAWGNRAEADSITLRFECTRREERALSAGTGENLSTTPLPDQRLLEPDRLGIIDDRIRAIAGRVTAGRTDPISRARAIYDYVIDHMAYDKITPGWGNGDTSRACTVGKGNCTDFSALFISLARAAGIPARFKMGCQIPAAEQEGAIAGYHCWAEFWLAGVGWVPVDASEGWKNPDRRDFISVISTPTASNSASGATCVCRG
jgi:transglutaminase-like putative cysteine protease